jgi:hypothetical protein
VCDETNVRHGMPTVARVTLRADLAPIRVSPDGATLLEKEERPRLHVKQGFVGVSRE